MPENSVPSVPESHQQAAEEVRAHLVAVRGGAPFLSPADAELLLRWLDGGVAVSCILLAIERAAESRRKRRSRIPLTLVKAKPHLGKVQGAATGMRGSGTAATSHPFAPTAAEARRRGAVALAEALETVTIHDTETMVRKAAHTVRNFLEQQWEDRPPEERTQRMLRCRETLHALDLGFSDEDLDVAAEELAHDEHRQEWRFLDTSVFWSLANGVAHAS